MALRRGGARVRRCELYGFIGERGGLAVPARFGYAGDFSEGPAAVGRWGREAGQRGEFRYVDRGGRVVIPGPFRAASHFFKGAAHVEFGPVRKGKGGSPRRTRRFAYIGAKGRTVFAYEFDRED